MRDQEDNRKRQRVLALKVTIDWKDPESKAMYERLRDLGWQSAHYKNGILRRKWAVLTGHRLADAPDDPAAISKHWRKTGKGELSGAAYSAAERDVEGVWKRDGKRILAGSRMPEWTTGEAFGVRGHKNKSESGIRLEIEDGQYVAHIQAQAAICEGGSWIKVPVARGSEKDWQAQILNAMVAWTIPISKAVVQVRKREIILRLTYEIEVPLAPTGERVATLGPLTSTGRLMLRTDTQNKDYTSRLAAILNRKDDWDLIRRRVTRQIGRRKGHARAKRQALARMSWDHWLTDALHQWSRDVAAFAHSQGVGTIQVAKIDNGDWPAYRFRQYLAYKAEEYGIAVTDAVEKAPSSERAMKTELNKGRRDVKRRRVAIRELKDQITKRKTA